MFFEFLKFVFRYCKISDGTNHDTHEALVKKLMYLVEKCPSNSESIRILWKSTFNGRRAQILSGKFDCIRSVLQECCPVLNQAVYVRLLRIRYIYISQLILASILASR